MTYEKYSIDYYATKKRSSFSTWCYGIAAVLFTLAAVVVAIDTRFRICKWTDTFSPNSIHASDEDIRNHCARTMGVFRSLYQP